MKNGPLKGEGSCEYVSVIQEGEGHYISGQGQGKG